MFVGRNKAVKTEHGCKKIKIRTINFQLKQNRMFKNDRKTFYKELIWKGYILEELPDAEENRKFWVDIWGVKQ